jgi:hypothetical protein
MALEDGFSDGDILIQYVLRILYNCGDEKLVNQASRACLILN